MNKTPSSLPATIDSRLAAYAAVATAALAAPALPQAEATIVYSGPVNINIPTTLSGVYLNVANGVNYTSPALAPGWDVNPWGTTNLSFFATAGIQAALGGFPYVGAGNTYFNLAVGTLIGGGSTFVTSAIVNPSGSNPLNLNSSSNFIGFRFFNELAAQVQYGWLQIMLSSTAQGQPRSIIAYAFEDSGGAIMAGATSTGGTPVPEPINTGVLLALVAAGAFGVRRWREGKTA